MTALRCFLFSLCFVTIILPSNAESLIRFKKCHDLRKYYIDNAVKHFGVYGIQNKPHFLEPANELSPNPDNSSPLLQNEGSELSPQKFRGEPSTSFGGMGYKQKVNPAPQEPGKDFSETNNQVKGVDEPDVIKTDGRRIFVVRENHFYVVEVLSNGRAGRKSGTLKLATHVSDILFQGNNVLLLSRSTGNIRPNTAPYPANIEKASGLFGKKPSIAIVPPCHRRQPLTIVQQVSVAGKIPKLITTLRMEGRYVSAREVNGIAHIVIKSNPSLHLPFSCGLNSHLVGTRNTKQFIKENQDKIRKSNSRDWLPMFDLKNEACDSDKEKVTKSRGKQDEKAEALRCKKVATGLISSCGNFYHATKTFSGFGLLSIVTIPLVGPIRPRNGVSIASDVQNVYSTPSSLYVATTRYQFDIAENMIESGRKFKTSFHKFALSKSGARFVASGEVSGSMLNQFSMHEFKGILFITTTDGSPWWPRRDTSSSKVTSFRETGSPKVMTKMDDVGNLGVGERIFAVRYIHDTAYVVTFKQVDPLYIISLADPKHLKVTGVLRIPGFSSYLHPVAPGRILGVGREVGLRGATGAKVTLFDVSVVTKPRELATWTLPGSYTTAEWDHKAFLYWKMSKVAVLPISVFEGAESFVGSIVLDVQDYGITERGRFSHEKCCGQRLEPRIERNLVVGKNYLWSLSHSQLQVNDMGILKLRSKVFFN